MWNRCIGIVLSVLIALLTSTTQTDAQSVTLHQVVRIASVPPTSALNGVKFLVGPNATGVWLNKDNQVATKNSFALSGWDFHPAAVGMRILDVENNQEYTYIGASPSAIWPGSVWGITTKSRIHSATAITHDTTVAIKDNGGWFFIDAVVVDLTIELPDPDVQPLASGMTIYLEQLDEPTTQLGATVIVNGGGTIRLPDGSSGTSWTLPIHTGTRDVHTFRLTAGVSNSSYAWYVSEF